MSISGTLETSLEMDPYRNLVAPTFSSDYTWGVMAFCR